jgi:hypothetical protein
MRSSLIAVLGKKFPVFMEMEGKLPCSEDPATGTDTEQMSCVHIIAHSFKIYLDIILPGTFESSKWHIRFSFSY